MEKNWKERAKSLLENDFFIDFDEPTKEDFVPADTADLKESFYRDTYDMTKDKISEEELHKALVDDGELISLNAGDMGKQVSFKDGGRYSDTTYEITEYDGRFSITEFHNSDDGDWSDGDYTFEADSFESLCTELERLFPGALVECKMTEDTHAKYAKPEGDRVASYNNALKYAKKEGKPYIYGYLNGAGKFFALEQPIKVTGDQVEKEKEFRKQYINCKTMYIAYPDKNFMEEIELTADELKDKYGTDDVDVINAGKEPEERVALKEAVEVVYAWTIQNDIYGVDWCSIEESDSEPGLFDGTVFLSASEAKNAAVVHLRELAEEGELEGEPSDYSVGAIDYPTGVISDETLEFSNIITEDFVEPDNAVVDCKVNKVIAHCEDEKPVDCLGEKEPLEKPLTEATEENVIYFSKAINDNVSVFAADLDQFKKIDEEVCKIWEDADTAGLIDNGEEEQKLCDQYGIEMFSGVELLDSLATKAGIFWEPVEDLDEEIESLKESRSDVDTVRIMAWCCHNCVAFFEAVANKAAKTKQRKLNKEAYKAMQAKFGLDTPEAEELMSKGYALWKSLYWRGTTESLKEEAATTEMYIIAADGDAGGSLYYIGTDYKAAQKEFKSTARDWRRYGLGGGDTPVYLYQYFGPAELFNEICSKYNAGENLDYSVNIEELGFDLNDCEILDEEWGD